METLHVTSDRERPRIPRRFLLRALPLWTFLLAATGFGAWVLAGQGAAGWFVAAVLVLDTALVCVLLAAGTSPRAGRLVIDQRDGSLRLPGAPVMWWVTMALLGLSTLAALVGVAALGAALVQGEIEVRTAATGQGLVLVVLTVMAVLICAQVLRGRIRAPYLELDDVGVTNHGMNASTTVLWRDVTGLRVVAEPGRRLVIESSAPPHRVVRSSTPGERPVAGPTARPGEMLVSGAFLDSDLTVVADLIQDLAGSPRDKAGVIAELRAGLTTGATLERLRAGRLCPGS